MPLTELVQQPEGGKAGTRHSSGGKPKPPRAPQQQDVCSLLTRVLLHVTSGQPLNLATVKAAWRELSFSHVFEVKQRPIVTYLSVSNHVPFASSSCGSHQSTQLAADPQEQASQHKLFLLP
jgi:hypothetical protein